MCLEHSPTKHTPKFRAPAAAGPRVVVYDVNDLVSWLAARKRLSTSEAPQFSNSQKNPRRSHQP